MNLMQLADIDFRQLTQRAYHPSPVAWEDQVLYFLMLDRFSDGRENHFLDNQGNLVTTGNTPLFFYQTGANTAAFDSWNDAGNGWCGGNLAGLKTKLGYLKRLGVTAIWISPLLKQVAFQPTYHGYGVQDFLQVDPHFGTREELRDLVQEAHALGIYVILDIIVNHTGNVFGYDANRYWDQGAQWPDPRWDGQPYTVKGFHDVTGQASIPFGPVDLAAHPGAWPNGAVWPRELQQPGVFTCKGRINSWDYDPEFLQGDFSDLKDVNLGSGTTNDFVPSAALQTLAEAYKYWIAYADLDGFRVDTVKHMDKGATRYLASVIHEFAQAIGKENFYLIGEITGGRQRAFTTLEETGLDAALGIDDIPDKLEYLVKGFRNPSDYFSLFRNSLLVHKESHVWFRNKVVTMFDDHDQVRKGGNKARFCAGEEGWRVVLNALALNATTLGIPCIYYGSEQSFNGAGGSDRYLRECMFGGGFGSFRSAGRNFFDEGQFVFQELGKILALRRNKIALRRGRQYLREISGDGVGFGLPHMIGGQIRSVVPWSRLFDRSEIVCAINTDYDNDRAAWVTIDDASHAVGDWLTCLYSTDQAQTGFQTIVEARNGKAVLINVPPAGFVIYE
jgi:glycosidase